MKHAGLLTCIGLSALPFFCGCGSDGGDPKKLATSKAGGVATFEDGRPVTNLKVLLAPLEGKGYSPNGNLDEQGKFQLSTYEKDDGAPTGKYKAYFSMAMSGLESGPPKPGKPTEKPRTGPPVKPEMVVAKEYLSAESSPLTVEIPAGGSDNIELKGIKRAAR